MEVYVARQPIFDKNQKIYGYELLFREGTENFFSGIDGNTATSKVLSNSFMNIGITTITGGGLAFVNFTRDLLVKQVPELFPKEKLVVEILEDVKPEQSVIKACKDLSNGGYFLALDDFFYYSDMKPLIALSNMIKFDFQATPPEKIAEYLEKISGYRGSLLAEKVETHEEVKTALKMGFEFFQGYFFSKPEILKGKDISGTQMSLLEIMAEVNKTDFKFSKVEEIINRDVGISYKLMRYINSAFFRRVNEISSIKQAIVLLGEKGMRSFLSLIAMSKLAEDKPSELVRSSIIRAKFCELIGMNNGSRANPSELFTLGLFSLIDAILDDSMENLMKQLPLSESIKKALIHGEGDLIDYLRLAVSYEKGEWDEVSTLVNSITVDEGDLPKFYLDALGWADALSSLN